MAEIARVSVTEAREKVVKGQALLICAYVSDEKFSRFHLDGAISFSELQKKLDTLAKGQELVFYCA